jgi:Protein of unknown function (DUF2023)
MEVFLHHLYEYHKGLRSLILHTMAAALQEPMEARLKREGIAYRIYPLGKSRINVFFGAKECVAVIDSIGKSSLAEYTLEEDFILGTMLGYSRLQQCERYLKMVEKKEETETAKSSIEPKKSLRTELAA